MLGWLPSVPRLYRRCSLDHGYRLYLTGEAAWIATEISREASGKVPNQWRSISHHSNLTPPSIPIPTSGGVSHHSNLTPPAISYRLDQTQKVATLNACTSDFTPSFANIPIFPHLDFTLPNPSAASLTPPLPTQPCPPHPLNPAFPPHFATSDPKSSAPLPPQRWLFGLHSLSASLSLSLASDGVQTKPPSCRYRPPARV